MVYSDEYMDKDASNNMSKGKESSQHQLKLAGEPITVLIPAQFQG